MTSVGVVVAKKESKRFPGKNLYKVQGVPLFWHAVEALKKSGVDDVYVATNSEIISEYCTDRRIKIIWRGVNASENEESLFSLLKFCYKSISKKYDYMVNVLANSIGHTGEDVNKALNLIVENPTLKEIRSYDLRGIENGILVVSTDIFSRHEISSYVGMIRDNAKEIHCIEDLDDT